MSISRNFVRSALAASAFVALAAPAVAHHGFGLFQMDIMKKWSGTLTWRYQQLSVGASARYSSAFVENGLVLADGTPWTVKSQTLANAFVKYDFRGDGWMDGLSLKVGANNLADKRPPVSSDAFGYSSAVYQAYPRYWYVNVTKAF